MLVNRRIVINHQQAPVGTFTIICHAVFRRFRSISIRAFQAPVHYRRPKIVPKFLGIEVPLAHVGSFGVP